MANNNSGGEVLAGLFFGAVLGALLTDTDARSMRLDRRVWEGYSTRERAEKLRSYVRNIYATVRDTPRSLDNQRAQCRKAARLAAEVHRMHPGTLGYKAVRDLERVSRDLDMRFGYVQVSAPAIDIS